MFRRRGYAAWRAAPVAPPPAPVGPPEERVESSPSHRAGYRRVYERVHNRRADFCHQTAHTLTTEHGLVAVEDLRVKHMTASAQGTVEQPGRHVRQKAGLNRSILDKAWEIGRAHV